MIVETAVEPKFTPQTSAAAKTMRAARNLLILPAVSSALKFQQQKAPKAPDAALALNRRQLLTLPAAALALPTEARADQAWAGPRWAEVDTKLPTNDQARVFRDLEDGFEVAYPSAIRRLF